MRPFQFTRADDAKAAILAIPSAGTPRSARANISPAAPRLLDLMKLDVMRPSQVVDINALHKASSGQIEFGAKGLRLGALVRMADAADHADVQQAFSGDRAVAAARRQRANPQHGFARRQRAAAHPLHLFPRHLLRQLQQAQPGLRLRRAGGHQPHRTRCSAPAISASPPIRAISPRR